MTCLLGTVAEPTAATRALEMQLFLFHIRVLAAIDDDANRGGEKEDDGHNYVNKIIHRECVSCTAEPVRLQ